MYNSSLSKNYGNYIVEQRSMVLTGDSDDRLKDYLYDDDLIEKLADEFQELEDGSEHLIQIDGEEFGIQSDDQIFVKVDKKDPNNPKFYMWIYNEKSIKEGVDWEHLADKLYQAGQEGGGLGYVGNMLGSLIGAGDAGDAGTDEESIAGIVGYLASLSKERSVNPSIYFKELEEQFNKKHSEGLKDFLMTEFSGRDEVAALNTFRQEIPADWTRGINLGEILLDIGLTVATFGTGTVANGALKGARVGTKVAKTSSKVGKTAKFVNLSSKEAKAINTLSKGFKAMSKADQVKFAKAAFKGKEISWITKNGDVIKTSVSKVTPEGWVVFADSSKLVSQRISTVLNKIGKPTGPTRDTAALLTKAIAAGGASVTLSDAAGGSSAGNNWLESASEFMGYYDGTTADPSRKIEEIQSNLGDHKRMAEWLYELKKGTGFWSNTTDQEELVLALIITSLNPDSAQSISEEYSRFDDDMTLLQMLEDEIGNDLGVFPISYLGGLLGQPNKYTADIEKIKKAVSK